MIDQNIKIAVDAIVFGYQSNQLFVLLVKQKFGPLKDTWCLPGGFVREDEGLEQAVIRELDEETGITVNYLEQLYTFGDDLNRDPRFRTISVAYFALADPSKLVLKTITDTDADKAQWFSIDELPKLGYDHLEITQAALKRLKNKLSYQPIGFDLLPSLFPFSELENLYTTILSNEIDRRNFRKKILSFGFIEETDQYETSKTGRPAKLFRFNKEKYKAINEDKFLFEIKFV